MALRGLRSGPGPAPLRHGRRRCAARRSTRPRCCPTSSTHQASASLRLRAMPASMRVSSTWRCDIRSRVMTGTLAVVNSRVVLPAVAPQETTRPKRACASSAMRIRCSRVSSRNRSIRASSAVAAASGVAPSSSSTAAERADDEDLVVVDGHFGRAGEEVVRKPTGEPGLDLGPLLGRRAFLGAGGPAAPPPSGPGAPASPSLARVVLMFVVSHEVDYMITRDGAIAPHQEGDARAVQRPSSLVKLIASPKQRSNDALREDLLDRAQSLPPRLPGAATHARSSAAAPRGCGSRAPSSGSPESGRAP